MVKKVMRPPCGSTSGGRPVAPCSARCHRGNPPVVQLLEKAEHFLCLDGFSLDGSARRTPLPLSSVKTRRTESTSTSIPLLPIAPISPRMRSDSDSSLATSTASLPRPSTRLGTIRRTWCPDHAEDIGVSSHLLHRNSVGMIRDSGDRHPPVAQMNEEQHIIGRQAPPR